MRPLVGALLLILAAASARATLVVIIPAKGATVVCADRRFLGTGGRQFDSDGKLQLLAPNAFLFIVGLEAVSAEGKVLFSPGTLLQRFLAEQAAEGVSSGMALQDGVKIGQYLQDAFGKFLSGNTFASPNLMPFDFQLGFLLGILRTDNHTPSITVIKVWRETRAPSSVTSSLVPTIERFFATSDPMYLGQLDVVQRIAEKDPQFSRFFNDPYVHEFILTNYGKPLTNPVMALKAARRLIAVTADGLSIIPRQLASVSKESVCGILDYLSETAQYR